MSGTDCTQLLCMLWLLCRCLCTQETWNKEYYEVCFGELKRVQEHVTDFQNRFDSDSQGLDLISS